MPRRTPPASSRPNRCARSTTTPTRRPGGSSSARRRTWNRPLARPMAGRFDLTGRVAIVTGSGQGIGRRVAQGLAEHGARVVIADIERDLAERAANQIEEQAGAEALPVRVDVTVPEAVDR